MDLNQVANAMEKIPNRQFMQQFFSSNGTGRAVKW
jgi:hypothetical protein